MTPLPLTSPTGHRAPASGSVPAGARPTPRTTPHVRANVAAARTGAITGPDPHTERWTSRVLRRAGKGVAARRCEARGGAADDPLGGDTRAGTTKTRLTRCSASGASRGDHTARTASTQAVHASPHLHLTDSRATATRPNTAPHPRTHAATPRNRRVEHQLATACRPHQPHPARQGEPPRATGPLGKTKGPVLPTPTLSTGGPAQALLQAT